MSSLGPLEDQGRVVIIGGGPSGVACALALQRLASERSRRVSITIVEGKQFVGERHYNQCVGVLSPPLASVMKDEFYAPGLERIQGQSKINKQGSGEELSYNAKVQALHIFLESPQNSFFKYKRLLELGVSRELARLVLPVNLYTEFYWKVDLRNLFNFINLRSDSHAQFEIREYSDAIFKIIKDIVPVACDAYENNK